MASETHDVERVTPMDEGAQEAATYDVTAVQDKWQAVWAELDPFRADDDSPREKRAAPFGRASTSTIHEPNSSTRCLLSRRREPR